MLYSLMSYYILVETHGKEGHEWQLHIRNCGIFCWTEI